MLRSTIISHAEGKSSKNKLHFKQLQDFETEIPWSKLANTIVPHYLESTQ